MENNKLSPNIDDFYSYYTSAPTSPRRYTNLNGFIFLSMPTSPTRDQTDFGSRNFDTSNNFLDSVDNFEFEGSKRFYSYDNEKSHSQSQSQELCMAYADELFFDGKMLPLRPPPRTRHTRSNNSSTASSPGTRTSRRKVPFLRQKSLWNDGYDPFTSALDKVRTDENNMVHKKLDTVQLRRAKSLSPLRLAHESDPSPCENVFRDVGKFESVECRKQKMKMFLLKNASFVKSEKKEQSVSVMLRKLQYSVRFNSVTPKTIIKISREIKSLMKHRAKFFFCLAKGFGKCSRTLS